MRELVRRYLDSELSRRDFLDGMIAAGFTTAAAHTILQPLDAAQARAASPGAAMANRASAQQTGGALVVAQARAAGVEYLFTNPGSYEVGFFDAFVDTPGLQLVLGLHEGIVVSMADGYHKVSGKPGFVNVHVIAGTAQMAGQLYNSSRDGSALVITAGLNDNEVWSDDVLLAPRPGFNQKEVVRQFTKIAWEARQPESLPVLLRRAFKVAMTEPGGPVYLAMAQYALENKAARADILPSARFMIRGRVRPARDSVTAAARMVIKAKRPVVVVGDEVWKSAAQDELLELSEQLGLPVASAQTSAFRNFPSHHPHSIGIFNAGSEWVKRGVDLLLCVGCRDFGGKVVPASRDTPTAPVIRIGIDTSAMSRTEATDVAVAGDIKEALNDLGDAVAGEASSQEIRRISAERSVELRQYTMAARRRSEAAARNNFGRTPMHPDEIGAIMAATLDPEAIIVSENLTGRYQAFRFGHRKNEQIWLSNSGASLGWGIGAATGAKLAAPDRQVVCSIGDGSVMYSASGFWTQARYHIPVLTVIWNNQNYQTVRFAYDAYKGRMAATGHYAGMYLGSPDIDFVKLAESQGVHGQKVSTPAELARALKRGIAATREGEPYVVEVATARYGAGADSTWHETFNLAEKRSRKV